MTRTAPAPTIDSAAHPPGERPRGPVAAAARALTRLASVRVWAVVVIGYGILAGVFFGAGAVFSPSHVQQVCGQAPPDLLLASTADEVHGFLEACGADGRGAYRALQLVDLVYPAAFALFLAASLALALRLLAPSRPHLVVLAAAPFVGAVFDYLENAAAWFALAAWPQRGPADGLLGVFSAVKTVTSWAAGVLLLLALAALVLDRARRLLDRRRLAAPARSAGPEPTGGVR